MLFQDSNVPSCSPIAPDFSPSDNIEQEESRMINLFRTYKEDYNQCIYQYENEIQSSSNDQPVINNQLNKIPSNISDSLQDSSFEYKDEINNASPQSSLPVSRQHNDFLANLNNFAKRNPKNFSMIKSSQVKHLSDDEASIIKDESIDDFICQNKSTLSYRHIEQSRSDISFQNYNFNSQQTTTKSILNKSSQVQNSQISQQQNPNEIENCSENLTTAPQINSQDNAKSDFSDDECGIPLGMVSDSKPSMNLSLSGLNKSMSNIEDKHTKHKSCRISLSESRLHGKNNSGEFVGRNPSLMTIVEDDDDAEEEFEYEEDYEEDVENVDKDINKDINKDIKEEKSINTMTKTKSLDLFQNKLNEKQISNEFGNNLSLISKNYAQPSESQHNISLGVACQIQTSNSTNNIPLNHYVKSYAGLNSKIIDLNPTDDDNEYDYDYDEVSNSPISLREASDINKYSHQSGLNGSRTIEDLIEEQKKAAIASSSSAIIALAANASNDDNHENYHNGRRTYRKRSNISLSELVPKERACFTVEDMMRLQNINFLSNKGKNATSNSGDVINKPHKPRYSEEDMIKNQKISMNKFQNVKEDSSKQDKKIENNATNLIDTQCQSAKSILDIDSINVITRTINIESDKTHDLEAKKETILNETVTDNFSDAKNEYCHKKSERNEVEQQDRNILNQNENTEQNEDKILKSDTLNCNNSEIIKGKAVPVSKQYSSGSNNSKFMFIVLLLLIQCILIIIYNYKKSK